MKLLGKKIWSFIIAFLALFPPFGANRSSMATDGKDVKSSQRIQDVRDGEKGIIDSPAAWKDSPTAIKDSPAAIKDSPTEVIAFTGRPKASPSYVIIGQPGKSYRLPIHGRWDFTPDGTFQKTDREGNRIIMRRDGTVLLFDKKGKPLGSKSNPETAEIYKAMMKSREMKERSK